MKEKNKKIENRLTLYMGFLYLFAILFFGLILINEKKKDILIPKIEEKVKNHIKEKYKEEFVYGKIKRKLDNYYLKVSNKKNNNLYFIATYKNKKITDTYKKDYLEGKTLNNYIEKQVNKNISENNYNKYKIAYNTKLTETTNIVKRKLLNKEYNIPIYTIEIETNYKDITELKSILLDIITYTKNNNLIPKNYNITLNNNKNITKSMNIIIDNDIIINDIDNVVLAVISNDQLLLQKLNIKLKYLN